MDLSEVRGRTTQRHPWELARAAFFLHVIREAVASWKTVRCLDVGCGDAWFARRVLERLPSSSTVTGWDAALDPSRIAELSATLPPRLTLTPTPPVGWFRLILCMDVLEHVENDREFLGGVVERHLEPGGLLLFTVPAWPTLFSVHDEVLQHYRRYTPTTGRRLLRGAGLRILRNGGLFHALAIVRWWQARRWRKAKVAPDSLGVGGWFAPPLLTQALTGLLCLEGIFSGVAARCGVGVPGLSWWALCQR